ncbi:MAG: site specific recombinase [Pseudomonadota bacterium]|jgi:integrase
MFHPIAIRKEIYMASYRKRKNKDGTFSHQFRIRRKGYPLVTKTFERKTDGEAWVQETETSMRAGKFNFDSFSSEITVAELITLYVSSPDFQKRKSKHSPIQTLDWWKQKLGALPVKNLCRPVIKRQWMELERTPSARTGRPLTNRTLNSYLETFSACLSHAVAEELLDENPVLKIRRRPLDNARERVLSSDELRRLLDAASQSSNRYLKTAILMSLSTGGRRGEVMGLTWSDVSLETGEVRFRLTKSGKRRVVVLGSSALQALREHSKLRSLTSPLIFPPLKVRRMGTKHVPWEDLKAPFYRACKQAGISDFRWHDLRHSAASFLIMSGATIEEAMKVLGHQSAAMSWRYAHLDTRRNAELASRVDDNFLAQAVA